MDQSVSPLDHLNDTEIITSQDEIITTQSLTQETEKQISEISDDEVQIVCVKRKEKLVEPCIKVESDDEEVENKDGSGSEKSIEVTGDGSARKKHDPQSQVSTRCNSPKDVTCSICLGEFDNKSFLDQCFHAFCFYCILQWSEIVRTCPLCKAKFSSIIHSVKSMMEYEMHKLPRQERPSRQQNIGHVITVYDNVQNSRQEFAARSSNVWEWRTRRRERRMSFNRRKQVEAKKKRKLIYARNLWVQNVTQRGRARFRDTSPQFFHGNPACTHRLVPWLTRELGCLLDDDHRHVDFLLQLIMTLITRLEIMSEEFIQELRPFLFDKTHHFAHEFLSFACSPFDMSAYDERAQYECPRENDNQESSETPFIANTSTTGWDSPDEFGIVETLSPSTNSPGPSGLSGSTLFSNRSWSPPLTSERLLTDDESTSTETALHIDEVTNHRTLSSPSENISDSHKSSHQHKHRYRGKGKQRSNKGNNSTTGSNCIAVSSRESAPESQSDIIISSEETSSPSISQVTEEDNTTTPKSFENLKRRFSSEESLSHTRSKPLHDSHKSPTSKKVSRKHSHDRYRGKSSRSSSRVSRRTGRSRSSRSPAATHSACDSRSPAHKPDMLVGSGKGKIERPSSPTEDEIKREISELERKIADDTKRLTQLLLKQEKRRLGNSSLSTAKVICTTEDSGTDELSR